MLPSPTTVTPHRPRGKAWDPPGFATRAPARLNRPVTRTAPETSYRLAPALGLRLVGRSLMTLACLVVAATLVSLLSGGGGAPIAAVTVVGLVVVAAWSWWLLRGARALRLTGEGYAVRLLSGVGVTAAPWALVDEAVAASPGGRRCLVLRLTDGRETRLPMAALGASPDVVARDVRRRLRDAHTSPTVGPQTAPDARGDGDPG